MIYKDRKRGIWLTVKLALDCLFALASFYLAFSLRYEISPFAPSEVFHNYLFGPYFHIILLAPLVRVVSSFMAGLYLPKKGMTKLDALFSVMKAVTLGSLVIVVLLFTYRGLFTYRDFSYSRMIVLMDLGINFILVAGSRIVIAYSDKWLKTSGVGMRKTLFIGMSPETEKIIRAMSRDVALGCSVVGYVGEETPGTSAPYLGPRDAAVRVMQERGVDEVYVLDSHVGPKELLELSGWCDKLDTDLRIVPSLYFVMGQNAKVDEIASIPTIFVKKGGIRGWDRVLKEAEDYALSIVLLIVLSPFMLTVAALIALESGYPVFFMQERVGKNGKRFRMLKFRSMVKDAEAVKQRLMAENEATGPIFKMKNDPRITRVGRFIRKTSIDELPQLFNVIKGEMSLVGPRPPIPKEVEDYQDWHRERLAATPGITGLWQVSGRSSLTFDEMVKLDIYYIRNWSLLLDLKILIRTIPAVIFSKGAY